jgi:hypothetical protein
VIFYVADVDAVYRHVLALNLRPDTAPQDALWGERYFHRTDPDGHELSFARPLRPGRSGGTHAPLPAVATSASTGSGAWLRDKEPDKVRQAFVQQVDSDFAGAPSRLPRVQTDDFPALT